MKSMDTRNLMTVIGHTEVQKNNSNPKFVKSIQIPYYFEQRQELLFQVYDIDSNSPPSESIGSPQWAAQHEIIGEVNTVVGEIVGNSACNFSADILSTSSKSHGKLLVTAEELAEGQHGKLILEMHASHLDKKDWFGKSDGYVKFSCKNKLGTFVPVFTTEVVKNSLDPSWNIIKTDTATFCYGDRTRPIKVECFDWDDGDDDDLIGTFETTVNQLIDPEALKEFHLINPKKIPGGSKEKKGYVDSGVLKFTTSRVETEQTFISLCNQGLQMNCMVAVDFTQSNGNVQLPTSLHYFNPTAPNQYEAAIRAVGWVISDYDNDKMFPAYGYGARLPPNNEVSHCFPMNFNNASPECSGVEGIVATYRNCVGTVKLSGPTNFSPVIQQAIATSRRSSGLSYHVLLIITDGVITDYNQTAHSLVEASNEAMSVIIIGVGNADFSQMSRLDADGKLLMSPISQASASRDIVQFVPFSKYKGDPERLAQQVLAELPKQVLKYHAMYKQ